MNWGEQPLLMLAHFGTYTYVTPFLREVTHAGPGMVTGFLLVHGAAGVAGNFLGGALVARYPHGAFGAAAATIRRRDSAPALPGPG